jgi:hypothetical protein
MCGTQRDERASNSTKLINALKTRVSAKFMPHGEHTVLTLQKKTIHKRCIGNNG